MKKRCDCIAPIGHAPGCASLEPDYEAARAGTDARTAKALERIAENASILEATKKLLHKETASVVTLKSELAAERARAEAAEENLAEAFTDFCGDCTESETDIPPNWVAYVQDMLGVDVAAAIFEKHYRGDDVEDERRAVDDRAELRTALTKAERGRDDEQARADRAAESNREAIRILKSRTSDFQTKIIDLRANLTEAETKVNEACVEAEEFRDKFGPSRRFSWEPAP